jgi:hypothetical protein
MNTIGTEVIHFVILYYQNNLMRLLAGIFFLFIIGCNYPKDLTGRYYRNNFPVLQFFGTRLRFVSPDSVQRAFSGDTIYDSAVGTYNVVDDKIYLAIQTLGHKMSAEDWKLLAQGKDLPINPNTKLDTIITRYLFAFGKNKLWAGNAKTGKIYKKEVGYSKRRKYFLFGSHYRKMKYYLKRIK